MRAIVWLRNRAGARLRIVLPRTLSARHALRLAYVVEGGSSATGDADAFFTNAVRG